MFESARGSKLIIHGEQTGVLADSDDDIDIDNNKASSPPDLQAAQEEEEKERLENAGDETDEEAYFNNARRSVKHLKKRPQ